MRATLSYLESIEHIELMLSVYATNKEKKQTFLKKGVPSKELDQEQEKILNDIQFITGERSIEHAQLIVSEYKQSSN